MFIGEIGPHGTVIEFLIGIRHGHTVLHSAGDLIAVTVIEDNHNMVAGSIENKTGETK